MCVIVVAVLHAVDDEGRINFISLVHLALVLLHRLPCLGLTESVLHGRSLHVVQDALLSHSVATHGRWRCQVLGQGRPNGKGVLRGEGGSRGTDQRSDWHLLGNGDKAQEIVLIHFREIHALGSIYSEASADEILCVVPKLGALIEREGTSTDLLVGLPDLC